MDKILTRLTLARKLSEERAKIMYIDFCEIYNNKTPSKKEIREALGFDKETDHG